MKTFKFQGLRRSMTHVVTSFVINHYREGILYSNADHFDYPYFSGDRTGLIPRGHIYRNAVHTRTNSANPNVQDHYRFDCDDPRPTALVEVVLLEDQLDNDCLTIYRNPYATFASRCQGRYVGAPNRALKPEFFPVTPELVDHYCGAYWKHKLNNTLVIAEHATDRSQYPKLRELMGLPERRIPKPNGFASSFGDSGVATNRARTDTIRVHKLLSEYAPYVLKSAYLKELSADAWGGYLDGARWVTTT